MTPTDPSRERRGVPGLTLRPAVIGEAGALATIHVAARREAPMPAALHSVEAVSSWLVDRWSGHETWAADLDGRVVGYARFSETWLDDLYVHPRAAGLGVGSALLDLVKTRRPDGFRLWVFETNGPARAFYGARALVELEHTDGSANDEGAPDLAMAWPGWDPGNFYRRLIRAVDGDLADLAARRAAITRAAATLGC